MDKCLVAGCTNHKNEGKFIGDLCSPCHTMLMLGKKMPSEAWFAKQWVSLTDEEVLLIYRDQSNQDFQMRLDPFKLYAAFEAKLKDKNNG